MEPPPPPPPSDSAASSPRSNRAAESSWDHNNNPALPPKLRLMCSYGGHIVPRPHDKSLCYVGGETRIVVADRHVASLPALSAHLSKTLLHGRPFTLKYQLPNEDLDSLITVSTDEDLENMIDEHDRTVSNPSLKPSRLRLFLFPLKPDSAQSNIGLILDSSSSAKSDDWFLNALNRGFSDTTPVNCLLASLDDDAPAAIHSNSADSGRDEKAGKQDVHSVPDSPMLETSSSFGSTSSSPSIANLPSIRVRAEEAGGGSKLGIEDQFANMVVGAGGVGLKQDEGFLVLSSPSSQQPTVAAIPATGVPVSSCAGDYANRVVSDDERSDHGIPIGFHKLGVAPPQTQQRSSVGLELPSPDSASSDSSLTNVISRLRPVIYQDQVVQLASGMNRVPSNTMEPMINITDPNTGLQLQQHIQESGYVMQHQVDPRQQPQQNQQQQQQQQQPFIQAGSHYIHQHPAGTVPVTTYYSVYPPQQPHIRHHPQLDQHYPMYYMPVSHAQAYNLSAQAQQPNSNDTPKATLNQNPNANLPARPQTPPNPTIIAQPTSYNLNPVRNAPTNRPEVAQGGVYRMATSAASPLVQQQYMGYSQIHHPSQSIPPSSGSTATFAYDITNPPHSQQIYYTQHLGPTLSSQYQTMAAAVTPDASGQHPGDPMKQQIRTSQAL